MQQVYILCVSEHLTKHYTIYLQQVYILRACVCLSGEHREEEEGAGGGGGGGQPAGGEGLPHRDDRRGQGKVSAGLVVICNKVFLNCNCTLNCLWIRTPMGV